MFARYKYLREVLPSYELLPSCISKRFLNQYFNLGFISLLLYSSFMPVFITVLYQFCIRCELLLNDFYQLYVYLKFQKNKKILNLEKKNILSYFLISAHAAPSRVLPLHVYILSFLSNQQWLKYRSMAMAHNILK